jgi:hypothetical protein
VSTASSIERMARLEEIRARDAAAGETWFKPMDARGFGACGQAFIDRRWLLEEIDRLHAGARGALMELSNKRNGE